MITGNERVYPVVEMEEGVAVASIDERGITIREHFAALAMEGLMHTLLPVMDNMLCPNLENVKYMADLAVTAADALIAELNKTEKP